MANLAMDMLAMVGCRHGSPRQLPLAMARSVECRWVYGLPLYGQPPMDGLAMDTLYGQARHRLLLNTFSFTFINVVADKVNISIWSI